MQSHEVSQTLRNIRVIFSAERHTTPPPPPPPPECVRNEINFVIANSVNIVM